VATVKSSGIYANTATITGTETDPDPTNNTSTNTPVPNGPPVANDDSSTGNTSGVNATLNILTNDKLGDHAISATPGVVTADIDQVTAGIQTTLSVTGEGTWTYAPLTGILTFDPDPLFLTDPTPITYTLTETATGLSDNALVTIDYLPVATNDTSSPNATGTAVTVNVTANDNTGDVALPTTVSIVGGTDTNANGTLDELVVSGQGTWSVNATTGAITFTPLAGYTGDPTPITYTVKDNDGNTSNAATVTIDYTQIAPVAVNDQKLANPAGAVTLNGTLGIPYNDTDANGDLDVTTVDLNPSSSGKQTTLAVSGEGTWSVNASGDVTFTPE
jgi:CshA-type fibril repeat protein